MQVDILITFIVIDCQKHLLLKSKCVTEILIQLTLYLAIMTTSFTPDSKESCKTSKKTILVSNWKQNATFIWVYSIQLSLPSSSSLLDDSLFKCLLCILVFTELTRYMFCHEYQAHISPKSCWENK